jgi:hypothetical protein
MADQVIGKRRYLLLNSGDIWDYQEKGFELALPDQQSDLHFTLWLFSFGVHSRRSRH